METSPSTEWSTTQMDAAIAGMQANSTPGVFSVDNDLIVPGPPKSE